MIRTNQRLGFKDIDEKLSTATLSSNNGIVSIELDSIFRAIEIDYEGKIEGESLLGSNYYIAMGSSKIVIICFEHFPPNNMSFNLFKYYGDFKPTSCKVVKNKYNFIYADLLLPQRSYNNSAKWESFFTSWEKLGSSTEHFDKQNPSLGVFKKNSKGTMINDINADFFELDVKGEVKSISSADKLTFYQNDLNNIVATKNLKRNKNGK
mgnify:FL=1